MGNSNPKPSDILKVVTDKQCSENENPKRKYKVLVAGSTDVGKSTLRNVLQGKAFSSERNQSIGANAVHLDFTSSGEKTHLCVYDTAGLETNLGVVLSHLQETDCLIMAYAVNSKKSFDEIINQWLPDLLERKDTKPINSINHISILGTKGDLRRTEEIKWRIDVNPMLLAEKYNAKVSMNECSSKTGENVNEFFWTIVNELKKHSPARYRLSP